MKLLYIVDCDIGINLEGQHTAVSASGRLRVLIPSKILASKFAIQTIVSSLFRNRPPEESALINADVIVVSKIVKNSSVSIISDIRRRYPTKPMLFDVCDDYINGGEHAEKFQAILALADYWVASTQFLGQQLRAINQEKYIGVIEEPAEHPFQEPKFDGVKGSLSLIVFGNRLVLTYLKPWIEQFRRLDVHIRLRLEVVTAFDKEALAYWKQLTAEMPAFLSLSWTQWSEYALQNAALRADVALIPSDRGNFGLAKSPNRVVTALSLGLPFIADEIPAYRNFRNFGAVGVDAVGALEFLNENPHIINNKVIQGQSYIQSNFGVDVIGNQWKTVLSQIAQVKNLSIV
jgi:hypothetical protein